ncbi:hypothetical protein AgCh_017793 [Apium graveolens]
MESTDVIFDDGKYPGLECLDDTNSGEKEVYQMDVKIECLNGEIMEKVYVQQPPGFEDPKFPDFVYIILKALYGLKQAPRAWGVAVEFITNDINKALGISADNMVEAPTTQKLVEFMDFINYSEKIDLARLNKKNLIRGEGIDINQIGNCKQVPKILFGSLNAKNQVKALFDMENINQDLKSDLKDLYINYTALRKAFRKIHLKLVRELEKKFSGKSFSPPQCSMESLLQLLKSVLLRLIQTYF